MGWQTCKYYYETDETPQPQGQNPNPEKVRLKSGIWATLFFSPVSKYFFVWLGLILYTKQTTRNTTQPNSPRREFFFFFFSCSRGFVAVVNLCALAVYLSVGRSVDRSVGRFSNPLRGPWFFGAVETRNSAFARHYDQVKRAQNGWDPIWGHCAYSSAFFVYYSSEASF